MACCRYIAEMARITLFVVTAALASLAAVSGHSYHLGNCPIVESQKDFNMDKVSKITELTNSVELSTTREATSCAAIR
jgi:hypothetical protein